MSLSTNAVIDGIVSHLAATGLFERVNTHEPQNAPGNGLSASVWIDSIDPEAGFSGLASTSARMTFMIRLYQESMAEPRDMIDPNLIDAVDVLFTAYSGDFDLGGAVRNVDLLGSAGSGLSARADYLQIDNREYRVMDITLPLVVNDAWTQGA